MRSQRVRSGFTLVELLMVIAIIAVLAALLLSAVVLVLGKGPELKVVNDIRQLEISVQNFKNKFKVFPPSRIFLYPNSTDYTTPHELESLTYINQLWPRLGAFINMSWNGADTGKHELEGDQCLVYFLGGPLGTRGFSTNPTNPLQATGDRVGPFYTFETARLKDFRSDGFFSYTDAWEKNMPYLYFSSGKSTNGYNSGTQFAGAIVGAAANTVILPAPPTASGVDNTYVNGTITITSGAGAGQFRLVTGYVGASQILTVASNWTTTPAAGDACMISAWDHSIINLPGVAAVSPYWESAGKYPNPNSFQIISAGQDAKFGPGGRWRSNNVTADAPDSGPVFDNQANFWTTKLGVQ